MQQYHFDQPKTPQVPKVKNAGMPISTEITSVVTPHTTHAFFSEELSATTAEIRVQTERISENMAPKYHRIPLHIHTVVQANMSVSKAQKLDNPYITAKHHVTEAKSSL